MNTRLRLWSATLAGLLASGAAAQDTPRAFVGATLETCAGAPVPDGVLVVHRPQPSGDELGDVEDAVQACPTRALSLTE